MNKEKIIQICYDGENKNPIILTNFGRMIKEFANGTTTKVPITYDYGDRKEQSTMDVPVYVWRDITPILKEIKVENKEE